MTTRKELSTQAALACLFAALCCAGAFISIPIPVGAVPLVLANFFVILAGLLLGPLWGGGAVALYLSLGALGFPVFAGGGGGLASFAGPHGGYLAGYLVGAVIAGLFARRRGIIFSTLGSFLGFSSILALGAAGLSLLSGLSLSKASVLGILPFLLGDGIKAIAATIVAAKLGPFTDSLIGKPKPNV